MERAASSVQSDWAASGEQKRERPRSRMGTRCRGAPGSLLLNRPLIPERVWCGMGASKLTVGDRSELDEDGLFMLDSSGEFTTGLRIADTDNLAGMTVFEGFDFQGNGECAVLDGGGDLMSSKDEGALADGPIQDGLGGLDVDEEFESGIVAGVWGEGFTQCEDVPSVSVEIGIDQALSAAQGRAGDENIAPEPGLERELPMADAFGGGEEFESGDEERGYACGGEIEDTEGEGFIGDGNGGPGAREPEFEFTAFLGVMIGDGAGEEIFEFGFIEEPGQA
jgi:hypothetical protein